ncbi:uncharacterized protein LOC126785656 [Argentina anserina]|uniref:uncharacterized protein LOC126785656 n=1 Tax=Argentina anserina TaxID=57926 RepID=UPI0021765F90|nr:uncharacterized protein LOC126785656 [Potentilla anserina]
MEPISSSSSSSSRVRVSAHSKTHDSFFTPLLLFFFFIATTPTAHSTLPSDFHSLYTHHCNNLVPIPHTHHSKPLHADLGTGYFTGGDTLFSQTPDRTALNFHQQISFQAHYAGSILSGYLVLITSRSPPEGPQHCREFQLQGHYSDTREKLCMVGTVSPIDVPGSSSESANVVVLKLSYPKNMSIFDILVTGTLESVSGYFEPISILGLSQKSGYRPTFIGKGRMNGSLVRYERGESLGRDSLPLEKRGKSSRSVCKVLGGGVTLEKYELEYESGYGSPVGGDVGYVPTFLVAGRTRCGDGKMQMLLGFLNSSDNGGYSFPFEPRTTLIAEGEWIEKENRVLGVACRILNFTDSLTNAVVGDCSTRLSIRFPARLSLRNRSTIVGQIWSNRTVNDSGYFGKIGFHHSVSVRFRGGVLGYKYEFTEYDTVRKMCDVKKTSRGNGNKYPDEHSEEMRLGMAVRNKTLRSGWVNVFPLFVDGDQSRARIWDKSPSTVVNMSYVLINYGPNFFDKGSTTIVSAEGLYYRDHGYLCMKACRHVLSKNQELMEKDTLDCAININLQFPPLDARETRTVNGSIESTRTKSDPLYFEPKELYSFTITERQAAKSISRMDLENLMVLISNTLACVFVGWQLYYVKKHPDVLPFISIVMVVVLILGHMIPLVSNFQAMFVPNHSSWQDKFLVTGEWLKVSEVIVSAMMFVAFLLQLWLLRLTWSSRQGDRSQELLRDCEMKVVCATLPLYIAGALISCFAHQWIHSHHISFRPLRGHSRFHQRYSLWDNLKPYSGLVLDGFLLPQLLFNLFFNSGEKSLSCTFYIGSTIIRLLPHAYDLYRARTSPGIFTFFCYYAKSTSDFYSTAWNIIIPCGCLLFAAIVFLQQRFGGRCILPKRFRQTSGSYEKVSVISSV